MKKFLAFVPFLLIVLLFLVALLKFGHLPEKVFYLYLLIHLTAGLFIVKGYRLGIILGIGFGLYFIKLSQSNMKVDLEWYMGVFYILMYIGLFFLNFKEKKKPDKTK